MNHKQIEGFAALFGEVPRLTEMEIRHEGATLRMRRKTATMALQPTSLSPVAAPVEAASLTHYVKAEHVGVIHPLVEVGALVKLGQVLGQIDTMRLLSDCRAPVAGTLLQVLVEEGQPVEYGQPLFELAPEGN
jgi:acetyl-CoA carboxylase biotin carboxyl carrier protein